MTSTRPLRRLQPVRLPAAVALGLILAACASGPPAPVVPRTTPGAAAPRPAVPPQAVLPAAPAPVPTPPVAVAPVPEAPAVETAPVRSGAVESRSVESRPLEPRPGAPAMPGAAGAAPPPPAAALPALPAPVAPTLPPNTRTGPRGVKVPFSDAALAELKAAETGAVSAAAAPRPTDPKAAAPDPKAAAPDPKATAPDPKAAAADPKANAAPVDAAGDDWAWPATGRVLQTFEQSSSKGIALGGRIGDPVIAAADGRVIFSGNGPRGYGNLVIVKHANDLLSVYAHNRTLAVKEGQPVKRGQKIAELGATGTDSAKLHFEIRQQGKPVDPMKFLPRR